VAHGQFFLSWSPCPSPPPVGLAAAVATGAALVFGLDERTTFAVNP
jgi:hypothetical protein